MLLMKTRLVAGLSLRIGAVSLPVSLAAAPAPTATKPAPATPAPKSAPKLALPALSAAQIIERNVEARGGRAAWQAVQTMSWKGKMGAGGATYETVTSKGQLAQQHRDEMLLPFTLEFKRPLKSRLELEFNGKTAVQVYDGRERLETAPVSGPGKLGRVLDRRIAGGLDGSRYRWIPH